MAYSLTSSPLAPATTTLYRKNLPVSYPVRVVSIACSTRTHVPGARTNVDTDRRSVVLGMMGVVLGMNLLKGGDESANAAGRRPPPGPPKEKQDPNITGLAAKILASKKRKEAMKEAVAKQRELGKPVVVKQE